jgi:4-diphosphocytidyl-2-C-methyl-D-erythritol kinase
MLLFAPAKVNLGLHVLYKREDGYHELETGMIPIPWYDVIEILHSNEFKFEQLGLTIPGDNASNLCVRACQLMRDRFGIGPVQIILKKNIPMGAGLGGGSSDAAYVIKGLSDLFELKLETNELELLASQLGSDCPFFIKNQAQIARGRGEILFPIDLDLTAYYIKLINPGIHISTPMAYSGVQFNSSKDSLIDLLELPVTAWRDVLKNDFEKHIFEQFPELWAIKQDLYTEGAVYAAMSGSGSTIFGLFKEKPLVPIPSKYVGYIGKLMV